MIKGHLTQWLRTISSFPPNLVYMSFFKDLVKTFTKLLQKRTEVYYKVRQVLQSVKEAYYKVRQVLQSVTVVTKCDRLLLQNET